MNAPFRVMIVTQMLRAQTHHPVPFRVTVVLVLKETEEIVQVIKSGIEGT